MPTYTKENFAHKKYAYLVPDNDPKALADAILYLLKNNKLRKLLSKNGPLLIKKLGFEKKTIVEKTLKLYRKTIENYASK